MSSHPAVGELANGTPKALLILGFLDRAGAGAVDGEGKPWSAPWQPTAARDNTARLLGNGGLPTTEPPPSPPSPLERPPGVKGSFDSVCVCVSTLTLAHVIVHMNVCLCACWVLLECVCECVFGTCVFGTCVCVWYLCVWES